MEKKPIQWNPNGGSTEQPQPPAPQLDYLGNVREEVRYEDLAEIDSDLDPDLQYDVLELPSKGRFYPSKVDRVQVSYLTAADENILTSPNLLQSGKMLDTLLKRKIHTKGIRADELLPGDRMAILLWLRATGYGPEYPLTLTDPATGKEFDHTVDLMSFMNKIRELKEEPDQMGEYTLQLPVSKAKIKFKILTLKDEQAIDAKIRERATVWKDDISVALTTRLEHTIVEVNGNRDKGHIAHFIQNMRAYDSLYVREKVKKIEPGLDLTIRVPTPSGGEVVTELPINGNFFWPQLDL